MLTIRIFVHFFNALSNDLLFRPKAIFIIFCFSLVLFAIVLVVSATAVVAAVAVVAVVQMFNKIRKILTRQLPLQTYFSTRAMFLFHFQLNTNGALDSEGQCDQKKIAKCLSRLPKNDFTRKMIYFDTSTKIT